MPKPCWMPGASCFKTKPISIKFIASRTLCQCISKGKAHKPFEFGSKVSISRTRDSGIILGALALTGNPYDGHTVQDALKQIKRIIGKQPEILIADRGYKGQKELGKTRLLTPSVPLNQTLNTISASKG